jgi:hypothetical protein
LKVKSNEILQLPVHQLVKVFRLVAALSMENNLPYYK